MDVRLRVDGDLKMKGFDVTTKKRGPTAGFVHRTLLTKLTLFFCKYAL